MAPPQRHGVGRSGVHDGVLWHGSQPLVAFGLGRSEPPPLNRAGLFRQGIFLRYWPFIIMAIAFAGVGLSEVFNRRGIGVLAQPLERTGVFLPMLPVLAFWVLPGPRYALLWFTTGLLYGLLAMTK